MTSRLGRIIDSNVGMCGQMDIEFVLDASRLMRLRWFKSTTPNQKKIVGNRGLRNSFFSFNRKHDQSLVKVIGLFFFLNYC